MTRTISSILGRMAAAGVLLGAALVAGACTDREVAARPIGSTVALAEADAGNPTLALDPRAAVVYAAWVETRDEQSNVYLARLRSDGSADGAPVRVNDVPGDASMHEAAPPQAAVGPAGEVYVVWERSYPVEGRRFPASDLRFARSLDGGRTFGPAVTVNSDIGIPASHTFHNVTVGEDGAIYVSWLDSRERDRARAVLAAHQSPASAAPAAGHAGHGHGGHGGGAEAQLPGSELWVAVSRDGGNSFRETAVVDRDVCPCCRTGLATAPDGSLYVVWRKIFGGDVRDIAIARSTDGGETFSAPTPVHRDGWVFPGCPHVGPSIAVGDDGTVHVAWYTGKEGGQGTYYAASRDGGRTFSTPLALLADEWVPPSMARVAVSGSQVWVAWDDRRAERDEREVTFARIVDGRLVEPTRVRGSTPEMVLSGALGAVAWHLGDTVQLRMMGE